MNYISPIKYANVLNAFRGINEETAEDVAPKLEKKKPTSESRAKIDSLKKGLSPDDQEKLESYISSITEIKKEIQELVKKGKKNVDEVGGDMMNLRLDV